MTDPRISQYQHAVLAMERGDFHQQIAAGPGDEVGQLGRALAALGRTLERRCDDLKVLVRITERINAGVILDEVMDKVYRSFRPIIPFDRLSLALLDPERKILTVRWTRTEAKEVFLGNGYWGPVEGSSLKAVMESRKPRILNDLTEYLALHPQSESTRLIVQEGMRSSLTCPLVALGRTIGMVFFTAIARDSYREAHQEFFLQLAGQFALIVEKSHLYQELREMTDTRDRFLGVAAYDLFQPLTAGAGLLELLASQKLGTMNEDQLAVVRQVVDSHAELWEKVRGLLDVNTIASGEPRLQLQEVDCDSLLDRVRQSCAVAAASRSVRLVLEPAAGPLPVRADPKRMLQVLENLVFNAIRCFAGEGRISLACAGAGAFAEIRVTSHGLGLADKELPRLLTLTPPDEAGAGPASCTGMGMAVTRKLLEAHGGSFHVESEGGGTVCTIRLPRC